MDQKRDAEIKARFARALEYLRRRRRHQMLFEQGIARVRLLRDQPVPCFCCGDLVKAGDQAEPASSLSFTGTSSSHRQSGRNCQ
jgi:hypothetical protein